MDSSRRPRSGDETFFYDRYLVYCVCVRRRGFRSLCLVPFVFFPAAPYSRCVPVLVDLPRNVSAVVEYRFDLSARVLGVKL